MLYTKHRFSAYIAAMAILTFNILLLACGGGGGDSEYVAVNHPPAIEEITDQQLSPGLAFSYQVNASDPDGDVLVYALSISPEGMAIDAATGIITWTPASSNIGNNSVMVVVSDGIGGEATESFFAVVGGSTNQAPVVDPVLDLPAQLNQLFTYKISASDSDGDSLTYNLVTSPAGMVIDSATGLISWSPTTNDLGYNDVTVSVNDGQGGTVFVSFTVAVPLSGNETPTLTTIPDQVSYETILFTYENIRATDPNGDNLTYTLFVDFVAPPEWIQLLDDGDPEPGSKKIVAIPPDGSAGSYVVTIKVDDGFGGITSSSFNLTVNPAPVVPPSGNQKPIIVSLSKTSATLKVYDNFRSIIVGVDPEHDIITYSVVDASDNQAVSGLSVTHEVTLDSGGNPVTTGIITWRPQFESARTSSYDLLVYAEDAHGGRSAASHITVRVGMAVVGEQIIKKGTGTETYDFHLPYIPAPYAYDSSGFPDADGMTFSALSVTHTEDGDGVAQKAWSSGRVSWTIPVAATVKTVTVPITNAGVQVDIATFNINVVDDVNYFDVTSSPKNYESLSPPNPYLVGSVLINDWNNDGRNDLFVSYDGNGADRSFYRWNQQSDNLLGGASLFDFFIDAPSYSVERENLGGQETVYSNLIWHPVMGDFITRNLRDVMYMNNSNGAQLVVVPSDDIETATPMTYSNGIGGIASHVVHADVYDAPAVGNMDYDNGKEVVALLSNTRKLIVINQNGNVVQNFPLAQSDCVAESRAQYLAAGDVNGDGLTDIVVATYKLINDDVVNGYYRSDNRVEIFLQKKQGDTYRLVSRGLYTMDVGLAPLTAATYNMEYVRPIRSMAIGDSDGDSYGEIAVAYRVWKQWMLSTTGGFSGNFSYVKIYDHNTLSSAELIPSAAKQTFCKEQNVWVATEQPGPSYDVRVSRDGGTTWTNFTSSSCLAFGSKINTITSTHRNSAYAGSNTIFGKKYVWFGTEGNGLVRFDMDSTWTVMTASNTTSAVGGPGLLNNNVRAIGAFGAYSGYSSRLFVGTADGLYRWSGNVALKNLGWTVMTTSSGLLDQEVRALWIGGTALNTDVSAGYMRVAGTRTGMNYLYQDNTAPSNTRAVSDLQCGMLEAGTANYHWVGTDSGLYAFQNITGTQYKYSSSITSTNAWLTTSFTTSYTAAMTTSLAVSDNVTGIAFGGPGTSNGTNWYNTRWVCTASQGLARMIDQGNALTFPEWSYFKVSNGYLPSDNCLGVATDSFQNVYVATDAGLTKFTYPTSSDWTTYQTQTMFGGIRINAVYVEPHAWNNVNDIAMEDVTGDGMKDLIVVSGGFQFQNNSTDIHRWDINQPINAKVSLLPQVYSGGDFVIDDYAPNKRGREVHLSGVYAGYSGANNFWNIQIPARRRSIAVGDINGDGWPEVVVGLNIYDGGVGRVLILKFWYE